MGVLVDDDGHHLGRRHRVDDELRRVVIPRDDVDALARDLVGDRLHARAAHADAGAHRIDPRVVAAHRDLGADTGVARRTQDLDETLAHFRHLELEELDQELRRRTREEELRAARLGAHFLEEGLDAVLRLDELARDHVDARDEPLGVAAEVDEDAVAVDTLDDAADELPDALLVGFDHLRTLGFAHLLHDHLLGLLRGDTTETDRLHRLLDETADLSLRVHIDRVVEPQFAVRRLEIPRVVCQHLPTAEGLVLAALAVDGDAHVPFLAVLLASGRRERRLQRLEDHFLVDALLVRDGIDHQHDFLAHQSVLSCSLVALRLRGAPCRSR